MPKEEPVEVKEEAKPKEEKALKPKKRISDKETGVDLEEGENEANSQQILLDRFDNEMHKIIESS